MPKAASGLSVSDDPLAYMDQLDINTKKLPQYSHVIETSPRVGEPERLVRICRCWQSKKFPYCDDTHKLMMEAGDDVGPFEAKLRDSRGDSGQKLKNVAALREQSRVESPFLSLRRFAAFRGSEIHAPLPGQTATVRARPVVAAALLSAAVGYAVAEAALRRGFGRPSAFLSTEKTEKTVPLSSDVATATLSARYSL
ncbi:zinc finger cdgsh type protein [Toxoplasma gondii TgCatPRC2]|uniref:Zinc finger cdgsh type protein n=9 Tax=Toxoplasma gondii TaxID=5811 RepID=B9PKK0_TOXGV|nr:zinc finger cdgsh type protein [Toxoplasma gondii ME49]EPR62714.1 zinc finger cdgsh type protein [Toxoplasma gondii GT1]ESS32091.1 zinc finger cdgsh type protein [Toxoplasma gondii VEG]KAF4641145.1 zinc finger cdgsh type protein [Toxoplasma gondii]KFG39808.1 zinc finger cdgsh type protein [Toxoplasma gondii p89]KFG65349.1 zinc finger cdgsh type protein [Toxoplasma gondii RUB]KYF41493.1 zinc finger cdgsh type protein [Toxoplasma gondii ARI]KYK70468.1 zinc finger cdgsh type protein [Toxopla|eukprot:XP_002365250.1 zinc finger cdgsh type protein [Toxoplasma gondii ME49]